MAEDKKWKKNLGFLESIMFDPVASGILGLGEGIMNLFGVSEKNSQIDALKDDYEKMKFSEDAMSRREARVKQIFGNLNNSMTGASQYLNGDTMRAMQNTKLATESAKATLDQRLKDEQYNMSITDKINQLEGQKAGYIPAIMGMLSGGLQGVFSATQLGMAMDSKEKEQDMIDRLFGSKDGATVSGNAPQGSLKDLSEALSAGGLLQPRDMTPYEYKIQEGRDFVKNNKLINIPNLEEINPDYYIEGDGDNAKIIHSKTGQELSYDQAFNSQVVNAIPNYNSSLMTDFNLGGKKVEQNFISKAQSVEEPFSLMPDFEFGFLLPNLLPKKKKLLGVR